MTEWPDQKIPTGKRHRTVRKTKLLVYDYHKMVIGSEILPAHRLFQPWQGCMEWRGQKVAITLGDDNKAFDWGIASGICRFIPWNEFFSNCRLTDERGTWDRIVEFSEKFRAPGPPESTGARQGGRSRSPGSKLLPASELFETDGQGRTRLFYAAERGDLAAVDKMIYRFPGTGFYPQRMGFIEKKDNQGLTAADVADIHGNGDISSLLRAEVGRMEYYG